MCHIPIVSFLLNRVLVLIEAVVLLQSFDITNLTSEPGRGDDLPTTTGHGEREKEKERERERD